MDTPMEIVGYFLLGALKEGKFCRNFIGKMRQVALVERKFVFFMANERSTGKKTSIRYFQFSRLSAHGNAWLPNSHLTLVF